MYLVEFGFTRSSKWPTLNKAHLRYTLDERSAIETVGRGDVTRRFHELDLGRFVSYILEARRSDLYVEHCLTSVVMALESISSRWPAVGPRRNRRGSRPDDLPDKLDNMNKCLRFIDAKYTGSWLRSLRNDMMHSGEVKGWSVREIDEATNELLVLATDIFFRVFGFVRETIGE
jgi:hypothetical protein